MIRQADAQAFRELAVLHRDNLIRERLRSLYAPLSEETGLPTLPEGYFWRVERDNMSIYEPEGRSVMVRLMRREPDKPRMFGSGTKPVPPTSMAGLSIEADKLNRSNDKPGEIQDTAYELLVRMIPSITSLLGVADTNSLLGDYPPKSL